MESQPHVVDAMLRDHDTFILDCDGVVWHGDELISGAREANKSIFSPARAITPVPFLFL